MFRIVRLFHNLFGGWRRRWRTLHNRRRWMRNRARASAERCRRTGAERWGRRCAERNWRTSADHRRRSSVHGCGGRLARQRRVTNSARIPGRVRRVIGGRRNDFVLRRYVRRRGMRHRVDAPCIAEVINLRRARCLNLRRCMRGRGLRGRSRGDGRRCTRRANMFFDKRSSRWRLMHCGFANVRRDQRCTTRNGCGADRRFCRI